MRGCFSRYDQSKKNIFRTFPITQHHHIGIRSIDENTYDKNKFEEQDEEDDVAIDDFRLDAR